MAVNFLIGAAVAKMVVKSSAKREAKQQLAIAAYKQIADTAFNLETTVQFEMEDKGANKIARDLRTLEGSSVEVGFPGGDVQYYESDAIDMAELALIHEFGTSGDKIPSRPANRLTYQRNLEAIQNKQAALYNKVILRGTPVYSALAELGAWYEAKLKIGYRRGPFMPLQSSTIRARRGASSIPLIDTGTLRASVTYKVKMGRRGLLR